MPAKSEPTPAWLITGCSTGLGRALAGRALARGHRVAVTARDPMRIQDLAAVTKRVLPGMRSRGRGHIVNISSVGGLIGNPGGGYYNATKFAVEGLSEALAKEVEPLGIRVTVVEPGPFRTDWAGRSLKQVRNPIDPYAATAGARRAEITGRSGKQPGDPVRTADAIIEAVESPAPPLNLVLGGNGLQRVREKRARLTSTIDQWESVTLGADYPRGRSPKIPTCCRCPGGSSNPLLPSNLLRNADKQHDPDRSAG